VGAVNMVGVPQAQGLDCRCTRIFFKKSLMSQK